MLSSRLFSFKGNSQGSSSFNNRHTKQKDSRDNVFSETVIQLGGSEETPKMTNSSFIYIVSILYLVISILLILILPS